MSEEVKIVSAIGKVVSLNLDAFKQWRIDSFNNEEKSKELSTKLHSFIYGDTGCRKLFKDTDIGIEGDNVKGVLKAFSKGYYQTLESLAQEFDKAMQEEMQELNKIIVRAEKLNRNIEVVYSTEDFTVIRFGRVVRIIPTQFVEFKTFDNSLWEELTIQEIQNKIAGKERSTEGAIASITAPIVLDNNKSIASVKAELDAAKSALDAVVQEEKAKLDIIKQEMELKMKELRETMELKKAELEEKKKAMERDIFVLDSELYALRSLIGDNFSLIQVRKGTPCAKNTPVVVYQKLRYLDEDLAKIKLIYNYNYGELDYFEEIIGRDDTVFNQFCPSPKCITLLKVSNTNKYSVYNPDNTVSLYAYENGNRIAILIRNGENLHILWTEEERIYIRENFVMGATTSLDVRNLDDPDSGAYTDYCGRKELKTNNPDVITDEDFMKGSAWKQLFSRKFIMLMLQGIVQYKKDILMFDVGINFFVPSKYVIYSLADASIEDNRFGTLNEYMQNTNKKSKKGDYILPLRIISGAYSEYGSSYRNHARGRGDKNRVEGCYIPNAVVPINLVEFYSDTKYIFKAGNISIGAAKVKANDAEFIATCSEVELKTFREELEADENRQAEFDRVYPLLVAEAEKNPTTKIDSIKIVEGNVHYKFNVKRAGRNRVWRANNSKYLVEENYIVRTTYNYNDPSFYVSCEKEPRWNYERTTDRRVASNVETYTNEFINLVYMSSTMLKYFMESKKIDCNLGWNKEDYPNVIKHLHKALKYVTDRERDEFIRIRVLYRDIDKVEDKEHVLMQWKKENEVRIINDYQAKRFVKYIKENYKETK